MIWTKVFGETSILVESWLGIVWTRWSSIFPKHSFSQVEIVPFILFFISSWWKIASAARKLINSVSQTQRRPLPSLLSLSFFYWYHLKEGVGEAWPAQSRPTGEPAWPVNRMRFWSSTRGAVAPTGSVHIHRMWTAIKRTLPCTGESLGRGGRGPLSCWNPWTVQKQVVKAECTMGYS